MLSKVLRQQSLSLFFLVAFFAASSAFAAGLPSSSITAPLNNSAIPAALGSYSIKGNAVDNSGTGLKKVEVSFNGGSSWNTATGTTSWTYRWSPLPLGSYSIQSRATDNSNAVESPAAGTHVVVDGSNPSSSITSPVANAYLKGTSVTIAGSAVDTGGAGVQNVAVGITPNGGSTSWYNAAGTTSWTYSWTLPADGGYNIKTKATDNAGNIETVGSGIAVTVDKTPPTVSAGANKTAKATFTQTATATDASAMTYAWTKQSGTGTITFGTPTALSTTVSASADGTYTLRFTATDAAGNSSYSDMTLTWDSTAPTVSAGANKTANASFTQTATASDASAMTYAWTKQSGTGTITFGSPTALSTTVSASADGTYTLRFTATDAAGNSSYSDMTLTWDSTAPTVSAGANKTANASFTQTATASDASAMTYAWTKQSGTGTITFGSPTALSTTVSASADGTYTLRFTATDAAGNSSYSDMTLTWDSTAPTSSVTAPAANANLSGTSYTITGTASDVGTGIQKVEVSMDGGGSWSMATGTTAWSYVWSLPINGSYTIKSRATDNAGNVQNTVTSVNVTVANILGTVALDRSSYNGPMDKATVTVNDISASITAGPGNDTITARAASSSDTAGEIVTLQEDATVEGRFIGSFGFEPLKAFAGNGKVYISKGDTVTVTYTDNTTPSGTPQDVTATAAWNSGRATWLANAADIINSVGTSRADLFAFCASPHGNGSARIDTVYLDTADAINHNPTFLRSFIVDAHSHNLRVECLMGAPGWATASGLATAAAAIDAATSFNDAGGVTERFDGIHLAVDPSLLSNWQTQTASVWSDYMALLAACQGKVNTYNGSGVHDLALGVDIPAWYDTAYPGITSSDSVQALVDYVVVMARKDVAADIESATAHEIDYAQGIGKKASVGVETSCGSYPDNATFCEEGYTVMDQRLGLVASYFQAKKSFMGLGINDYQAYSQQSQLPNSPVTGITDPAANATISGTSYTVRGTASSVIGVQTVEVSTDGGSNWYAATDTSGNGSWSTWSYSWTPLPAGNATIKARATDTMGYVESPGASVSVQVIEKAKYTLTVAVNGDGTVTPTPAAYYLDGDTVTLTAAPSSSCVQFTGWTGDAGGTSNPLTVTMNQNKVITANFATIRYNLATAVNDPAGGVVTPGGDYNCGDTVQVSATANPGYAFTGWSGDATGTVNPLTVTMTANKNITANFKRQGISLAYSQNGTSVTLTATIYYNGSPVSGKKITFYEGTVAKGTKNTNTSGVATLTFTSTLGAHSAYASFPGSGVIPAMQSGAVAYTVGKVILTSPANGSVATSPNPTLSWQEYGGATLYYVQVSTSTKFGSGTLTATTTGTSVGSPMTLARGKTYYWRVNADIPTGKTAYSDTWKMTY